jgi:hypothetical protein
MLLVWFPVVGEAEYVSAYSRFMFLIQERNPLIAVQDDGDKEIKC